MGQPESKTIRRHFRLDATKVKHVQKILGANTETEAIHRALDFVISEDECNRLAREASERFIASGVEIRDVYGKLAE